MSVPRLRKTPPAAAARSALRPSNLSAENVLARLQLSSGESRGEMLIHRLIHYPSVY